MRIISVKKLREFWESGYADSEQPLKSWIQICKEEAFANPSEIKRLFSTSSFVGSNRVVCNIAGNKYRLVVHIRYDKQILYVKFIGTHAQYDKINVREV